LTIDNRRSLPSGASVSERLLSRLYAAAPGSRTFRQADQKGRLDRAMRLRKESDDMQEGEILLIAQASDALAHPARVKIFRFILRCNAARTPVCNKDVVARFNYSQATISQHIKKLIQGQLIQVKKKDTFSLYFANIGMLGKYVDAVKKFE
jgi:ArsR family transcriptional regulator